MPILPDETEEADGRGCTHIGRVNFNGIMSCTRVEAVYCKVTAESEDDAFMEAVAMGLVGLNGILTRNGWSGSPPSLPKAISFSDEKMEENGGVWLNGSGCWRQKSV